ncbi:hypothetical protein OnM2_006009, partial [Erysiphe neolycopersici]
EKLFNGTPPFPLVKRVKSKIDKLHEAKPHKEQLATAQPMEEKNNQASIMVRKYGDTCGHEARLENPLK